MRNSSVSTRISSTALTAIAVAGCSPSPKPISAVELALREARALHRASKDATLLVAMPAVRRAHTAGVLAGLTLSALYRQRHLLQRKHFLRTLSVEAGFASWDAYLPVLRSRPARALEQCATRLEFGYPNAWFSTYAQAIAFANEHGGKVVRHGHQAMVVRPECSALKAEVQHGT
ncbi:hypothetical protein [Rhodoferax mekongensis]|uniref:hypothetical protein n=1 Tax=Rhodoferax mekongensis TaxID=3068341 RepID=UPI0028BD7D28|nr:hypothetical protein [Rhodoferax sp. TBRC 17199]MDT7513628.1 hypothetical protein [Rhodoferax sp. TBRC 17199]